MGSMIARGNKNISSAACTVIKNETKNGTHTLFATVA